MVIYKPLKSTFVTQSFGENKPCVKVNEAGTVAQPYDFGLATNNNVCQAGYTKLYQTFGLLGHNGYDWVAGHGTPIYYDCNLEGLVLETAIDPSGGLGVVILTRDTDGRYYKHRYWHLKRFRVQVGDKVRMGRWLGDADSTGASSGDHLHRDLKECDKDGRTINEDNGYRGAISMDIFYNDSFVLDQLTRVYRLLAMFPFLRNVLYPLIWG